MSPTSPFSPRDLIRLQGVHPSLIQKLGEVYGEMAALGHPLFVVMGVRTVQQQQVYWNEGRTTPGPHVSVYKPLGDIVTMCDGIKLRSNHQVHADGLGHAVDSAFQAADPFADDLPWLAYGVKLEARGLVWGGRWSHPHDSPHAELPDLA